MHINRWNSLFDFGQELLCVILTNTVTTSIVSSDDRINSEGFGDCSELTIFAADSDDTAGSEAGVIGARSVVMGLAEVV